MTATLDDAIRSRLASIGGAVPAVGDRWYHLRIPEDPTLPAGAWQRVAGPGDHTHDGLITMRERRVQFTIYDRDSSRAAEARADLIAALAGTRTTWGDFEVSCRLADEAEDMDPEPGGLYRSRVDLYLMSTAP